MNYVSIREDEFDRLKAIERAALVWQARKDEVVRLVADDPTEETYIKAMEPLGHALDALIDALKPVGA